jgi:hypothetical protein
VSRGSHGRGDREKPRDAANTFPDRACLAAVYCDILMKYARLGGKVGVAKELRAT